MADNQFINFNSQDVADMYRRNQYARMLQDQAAAPIERASYKGIEADIHPMQGVAKLTAALLAGYQQNQMDKSYASEKAAAEQKLVAERERSQNEFREYGEQYNDKVSQGYSPDYVNSPSNYGTPQTVSTPLSPQQRLAVAMKNRMNPNERIASDARAEIEQGNTIAQNEARTAERLATEATRVKERKEDIKIRADDRKAAREDAQRNKQPTAPAGYRFTPSGDLESIRGGPADAKTIKANSAQETGRENVSSIVDQLRTGYNKLDVSKAITNPQNSLMDNLSAGIASSGTGQAVSNLAGTKAQSIRNEIKMTRPLLLQQIMKATGMSATQINSNAELNLWLTTATDTSVDIESNHAALNNIEKMFGMPKAATPAPTPVGQGATGATVSNWNK
jgi:hypothetical protein